MCEEIKEEGKSRVPMELLTAPYACLSAFGLRRDRLLFCNKCAKETSHELIRLIEPLSELELLQWQNRNSDFKRSESIISHLEFEIGHKNRDSFLLFNKCRVCDSVIIDLCKSDSPTQYMVIRVYPREQHSDLPEPNQDMSPECLKIYKEAAGVFSFSPRASAGLMRLCLQQFLLEQDVAGKTLDQQIGILKKECVPEYVINCMDVCRVVGNSGVHPMLEINVCEDPEMARGLFVAMNIIVQQLISKPREIQEMYSKLPQSALKHIEQRDSKNSKQ